jgi:transcriptional regulator with XRE-family HTH domain
MQDSSGCGGGPADRDRLDIVQFSGVRSTNFGDRSPRFAWKGDPQLFVKVKFSCVATAYAVDLINHISQRITDGSDMITAAQLRAARALAGLDQRRLAELSGLSLPTIQRMETSEDLIRGNVDSLTKLITALDSVGIELIGEGAASSGTGRGVRLKRPPDVSRVHNLLLDSSASGASSCREEE